MAVFCEIKDVVEQIRYKTQIFYEAMKRDSIADQLYNYSNEDESSTDQSIPYSKSLDRDFSFLFQSPPPPRTPTPTITTTNTSTNSTTNANGTTTTTIHKPITANGVAPPPQTTFKVNNNNTNNNNNNNNNTTTTVTTNGNNNNATNIDPEEKDNKSTCKIVTFSASQNSKSSISSNKSIVTPKKPVSTIVTLNFQVKPPPALTTTSSTTTTTKPSVIPTTKTTTTTTTTTMTTTTTTTTTEPVFIFSKHTITQPPQQAPDSLLTKMVKPNDNEKDLFSDYGDIIPPPGVGMLLTVYIQGLGMSKIRVIDKATVLQTIVATLKTYFQQQQQIPSQQSSPATPHSSSNPLLYPDPKAYFLRIANEDGKIDEDYPTLDPAQMIYKFRDEIFVLCLNPKYESDKKRQSWSSAGTSTNSNGSGVGVNKSHSSNAVGLSNNNQNNQNNLNVNNSDFNKGHTRKASSNSGNLSDMVLVNIKLPDSLSTKVAYQPDMKLKELLISICKRRQLNVTDHTFQFSNGTPINLQLSMDQLNSLDIELVSTLRKSMSHDGALFMSGNSDDSIVNTEQGDIFWYDSLAWQYKQYEVTKIKKYGSKQERTIGIDKERITNMSPNPKKETKRPSRLIKDISKIALTDKPKHFSIDYLDGKSYVYETKTHQTAVEIVGKIQYIIAK